MISVPFANIRFMHIPYYALGFGVIHSDAVVDAFRAVDRRYFVPSVSVASSSLICFPTRNKCSCDVDDATTYISIF